MGVRRGLHPRGRLARLQAGGPPGGGGRERGGAVASLKTFSGHQAPRPPARPSRGAGRAHVAAVEGGGRGVPGRRL